MSTALIFDTETTGLVQPSAVPLDKQPSIIELAAVLVKDGSIIEKYSELYNPGMQLPEVITKITGLTDDDLRDALPFAKHYKNVAKLFNKADVLIAHNAPFDTSMLTFELQRLNRHEEFLWPGETLCTVQEFMHIEGRRMKLVELYEHFMGKPLEQTHRAMDDVMALYEICKAAKII